MTTAVAVTKRANAEPTLRPEISPTPHSLFPLTMQFVFLAPSTFSIQHRRTPVLGDEVYGNKDWNRRLQQSTGLTRPLLHARSLQFKHPNTGELISLTAPLPADVAAVVRRIYPQVSVIAAVLLPSYIVAIFPHIVSPASMVFLSPSPTIFILFCFIEHRR